MPNQTDFLEKPVGFNLVEVAPPNDTSELTAQLGSTLIINGLAGGFPPNKQLSPINYLTIAAKVPVRGELV